MYLLSFPRFWTLSIERFWFLFWSILNAWHWKPQIAMNTFKNSWYSSILHSRTVEKLADNENKNNFEVQPLKLLWIWIFGLVANVRAIEENYSISSPFIRLDCCSEWLISLYLWRVACDILYVGWTGYLLVSGFAIMMKQCLSSFVRLVAGRGILVSCIFVCFSIHFQSNSCGCFVCLFVFFPVKLHFLVF